MPPKMPSDDASPAEWRNFYFSTTMDKLSESIDEIHEQLSTGAKIHERHENEIRWLKRIVIGLLLTLIGLASETVWTRFFAGP